MKKLKIGFGEGGFPGFMARHVEKIVLGVVVALMAYFIYSGSSTSSLENKNLTREILKKNAADADLKITNSSWTPIALERTPKTDVFKKTKEQTAKVDPDAFPASAWDLPHVPRLQPRKDPRLYGAERLVVTPIFGPLVLQQPEVEDEEEMVDPEKWDPLLKYKVTIGGAKGYGSGASELEEEEVDTKTPKAKTKPKPKPSAKSPMSSMPETSTKPKRGSKKGDDPYSGSVPDIASMTPGSTYGAGASKERKVPPEARVGVKATQGALLQPKVAMVITASVPYAKQWEEFRSAFKDAPGGQDPARDVPMYLGLFVERWNVSENPDAPVWENLSRRGADGSKSKAKLFEEIEAQYGAQITEIADPDAWDDPILTHPVPPFLLTDLTPVMLHPDILRMDPKKQQKLEREALEEEDGSFTDDGLDLGSSGSGESGTTSSPRSTGSRPSKGSSMPRTTVSGPRPRPSSSRPGSVTSTTSGGASGANDLENYKPTPKKLIRFVDFDAEAGQNYRYRIQLVLEDPNHPKEPEAQPEATSLDDAARDRVKALEAKDAAATEKSKDKEPRRTYHITSPWSEPSEMVSVPAREKFYAGETIPSGSIPIGKASVPTGEPSTKVLTVQWDDKLGVFAPAEQNVFRGSLLNIKSDVEVLHPVLGDVRKIPEYQIRTNGVVLDMIGGTFLPGSTDAQERERAPGETLILDASGNLVVTNESRDVEGYRKYIYPEPKAEPMATDSTTPGEMDPGYPMGTGRSKSPKTGSTPSSSSKPSKAPRK